MNGSLLSAFLEDRAALAQARERADAFSRAWHAGAGLTGAIEALDGAAAGGGIAVQTAIAALVSDPAWMQRVIAPLVRGLRDDPWFEPPLRAVGEEGQAGLLLVACDAAAILLVRLSAVALARQQVRGAPRSITMPGSLGVIHVLEPGGARLRWWHADPIDEGFSMLDAPPLRRGALVVLEAGQTIRIDGRSEGFTIEGASADLLLLRASVHVDRALFQREFDTVDGRMVAASATREDSSRTRMLLTMLRSIGCSTAGEAFEVALGEPEFDLRWHAMREWLLHDLPRALPQLERMADGDPHPEVRTAARATLARLAERRDG